MVSFAVNIKHKFSAQRISDLLCCAFEGGSNYWIEEIESAKATGLKHRKTLAKNLGLDEFTHQSYLVYPLVSGYGVIVTTDEAPSSDGQRRWLLDLKACIRGLELMAEKCPEHFADFVAENDDANTGDAFLQLALFGEVVFC